MKQFDYLIVGAGLFGAVFACEAVSGGQSCLVIDKRDHIAGNAYTEDIDGIQVHRYGAHIFHTNKKAVWDYVNKYAEFNNYTNTPMARFNDELFNLPFNMNTFYQMWRVTMPSEAMETIESQKQKFDRAPENLEEQALSLVGRDIYEKLIRGYTEKQWGRQCRDLPPSIIKRLPIRFTFDNNYFNDRYQGIPIGGYTKMVDKMLEGCDVLLGTDYFNFISEQPNIAKRTVYTGPIDAFFGYCFGPLVYRSLRFNTKVLPVSNYQGVAVVNYTARDVPFTRIIEHKHFEFGKQEQTVITHEYPMEWVIGAEPFYPLNDDENNALYLRYKALAKERTDVLFGGRLGTYAYFDMDKVIESALKLYKQERCSKT